MSKNNQKNSIDKKTRIIIIILIIVALLALCVTLWAVFLRDGKEIAPAESSSETALAPDYAPKDVESNAEPMGDEGDEKMSQPEGGGAVSLTYSKDVSINLSDKTCSLLFGNPTRSNQDMVVQIIIQDEVIVESGRLEPGNQVTKLDLTDEAAAKLSAGGYEGKISVLYYQQDTGEKAIVNTEIPVTIEVTEN